MVREGSGLLSASSTVRHWWASWSQRVRGEAAIGLLACLANVAVGAVFILLTVWHLGPTGRGEIGVAFTLAWVTTSLANLGMSTSGRSCL